MKRKLLPFYATNMDLNAIWGEVGASLKLIKLTEVDSEYESFAVERRIQPCTSYVICASDRDLSLRRVAEKSDRPRFVPDVSRPGCIVLHSGGGVSNKQLLAGQIGTSNTDSESISMYQDLARKIRKRFKKIKSYYVGPQAAELLDLGVRLTPTMKSPPEYDLSR